MLTAPQARLACSILPFIFHLVSQVHLHIHFISVLGVVLSCFFPHSLHCSDPISYFLAFFSHFCFILLFVFIFLLYISSLFEGIFHCTISFIPAYVVSAILTFTVFTFIAFFSTL